MADTTGQRWIMDREGQWGEPTPGSPVALGKLLEMTVRVTRDTPERVASTTAAIDDFIETTLTRAQALDRRYATGSFDQLESLVGVLRYHAITCPSLTPVLVWPTRCMHATVNFGGTRDSRTTFGLRIPVTNNCVAALRMARTLVERNDGIAFACDKSPIAWSTAIWLVHDAAGKSDKDPDDYRGHFTWIVIPEAPHTYYVKGRWTAEQLLNHSTALELAGASTGLEEAIRRVPQGVDLVECFDSQAATACGRRLTCRATTMMGPVEHRSRVMDQILGTRRTFLLFFERKLNQIADNGSKDLMERVSAQLAARGLQPPRQWPTAPCPLAANGAVLGLGLQW